jgi:Pentapeptide repeats (8 copies)
VNARARPSLAAASVSTKSENCRNLTIKGTFDHFKIANVALTGGSVENAKLPNLLVSNGCLANVRFTNAKLRHAHIAPDTLQNCFFEHCDLSYATIRDATLEECNFDGATWLGTRLSNIKDVAGCDFRNGRGTFDHPGMRVSNVQGTERAVFSDNSDYCQWSRLRTVGRIRLFSISYLAIIAIWLYGSVAYWYNAQLSAFWNRHPAASDYAPLSRLTPLPLPWDLAVMLLAIVLLAIATTIYHISCPPIINENSETEWTIQNRREAFEYRLHDSTKRKRRTASGAMFLLGGGWILLQLAWKVLWTVYYLFCGTLPTPPTL